MQFFLILNVDDYHNLHDTCNPDVTSISQLSHMATILINNSKIPPVPAFTLYHPSIYNPQKLDANLLKKSLVSKYSQLSINAPHIKAHPL